MTTITTEERRGSAAHTDAEVEGAAVTITKVQNEDEFPTFKRVILIMPAVYLSMFLVALVS